MEKLKRAGELPHASAEEERRIHELRKRVEELYNEANRLAREGQREQLDRVRKQLQQNYKELVKVLTEIVKRAPESKKDVRKVSEDEVRELQRFWEAYFDHPIASWKLAELSVRLGDFKRAQGDAKGASEAYKEAADWTDRVYTIVMNSQLQPKEKVNLLEGANNLMLEIAEKLGDEELRRTANARKVILDAWRKAFREGLPQPDVIKLVEFGFFQTREAKRKEVKGYA